MAENGMIAQNSLVEDLPDTVEVAPINPPVQMFEMSVWQEKKNQDSAILVGYIEDLFRRGRSVDEISAITKLSGSIIRKKLNMIANSHLGKVNKEVQQGKRLEVDEQITQQLVSLIELKEHCLEEKAKIEVEDKAKTAGLIDPEEVTIEQIAKLTLQINNLLKLRMKLWQLDTKEISPEKPKFNPIPNSATQINTYVTTEKGAEATINTFGDYISGVVPLGSIDEDGE